MTSSEKPGVPSGFLVLIRPIARDAEELGELELERAGVLAAGGVDRQEAAAGDRPPASIDRPTPVGGLNATSSWPGPMLPPPGGKLSVTTAPSRSTLAASGPSWPEIAADSSTGKAPLSMPATM